MLTVFVQKPIYAECRYAECLYSECRYAECCYAECRYAECRYAECRGVDHNGGLLLFLPTSDSTQESAKLQKLDKRYDARADEIEPYNSAQ